MLKTGSNAEVCCIECVASWGAKKEFQFFSGCFRNSHSDSHKQLTSSAKITLDMLSAGFIYPIICRQQLVSIRFLIPWTRLAMKFLSFSFELIQPRTAGLSHQKVVSLAGTDKCWVTNFQRRNPKTADCNFNFGKLICFRGPTLGPMTKLEEFFCHLTF